MADGIDIGTAWLNVVPSFRGMAKAIGSEMDGAERLLATRTNGALSRAGLGAAKTIGGALSTIGKVGFGAITAGVAGVGASFAALMPEVIAASDATDKFKSTLNFAGLGSAQIDALTKSTKAYADKTVYDLADIQNVTAQLAANSVDGFDKLAEAAGNLNAVAGGNKDTFRSVGLVLTQTAGAGKLTTENWNQLADAIPGASGKLQEAMKKNGAYTGDFRDAMAKGQITAEEFNAAIMELGLSDAAIEAASSTKTFEGAWGNLQASMVTGMTAILDKFKPAATEIMSALADQLGPAFEKLAEKVGPLADKVADFAARLADGSITIEDIAKRIMSAAAGFATLWGGGVLMGNIDTVLAAFDGLNAIPDLITGARGKAQAAAQAFPGFMDTLKGELTQRASAVSDAYKDMGIDIGGAFDSIKGTLSSKAQGLGEAIAAPMRGIGEKVTGPLHGLGEKVSNAFAPLGNVGSSIAGKLDGALAPVKNLGGKISSLLSPLGNAFSGLGDMIGGPLQSGLGKVGELVGKFFSPGNFMKFFAFGAIAASLVTGLGAVVSSGGQEMLNQINTFAAQLPAQITALVSSLTASLPGMLDTGVQVITTLLDSITQAAPTLISGAGQIISSLVTGLGQALPQLIPMAATLLTTIATSLVEQLPLIISAGLDLLMGLVQGLVAAIPVLLQAIPQIITGLVTALVTALPQIIMAGVQLLLALIQGVVQAIPQLLAMLPTIITSLVEALVTALPLIIQAGIQILMALIDGLLQAIPQLLAMLPTIITTLVEALMANLPTIITAGIQLLVALINGLLQALPQLIAMAPTIITTMVTTLAQNFPAIIAGGVQAIGALVRGLVQAIPQIASTMSSIPGKMLSALGNLGSLLVSAGRSVIDGFINGIKSAIGGVQSALSGLTSMLPDWKGPAPVDRVILRPAGRMVIEGFQKGLESQYDSVRSSLGAFTQDLSGDVSLRASMNRTMPARPAATPMGQVVFNVSSHDARVAAREVHQEMRSMMGVM